MQHPDLEKQLADLKAQRKEATQALRDLASEAMDSTDKVNKTMMMFVRTDCESPCDEELCECTNKRKKTSRIFSGKKLRKKLKGTNGTHP